MEKKNRFGDRLKQLRTEHELTLEEAGKIFGKSRASMGHYERGLRSPDIDDLIAIAKHFNVSVSWLVGDTDNRTCDVFHQDLNGHDLRIEYKSEAYPEGFTFEDAIKVLEKLKAAGVNIDSLLE